MGHHYTADSPLVQRRYALTLQFMRKSMPPPARILDLGEENPFSTLMMGEGYEVSNTSGDLDEDIASVTTFNGEAVTAFEILEHLVSPYSVLKAITTKRLFATVPLRLWFAPAYRHPTDPWDRHFHEFEDWQFDWLLEKAGWTIIRKEKWTNPSAKVGFRPMLRRFAPRYYAIEAIRQSLRP